MSMLSIVMAYPEMTSPTIGKVQMDSIASDLEGGDWPVLHMMPISLQVTSMPTWKLHILIRLSKYFITFSRSFILKNDL